MVSKQPETYIKLNCPSCHAHMTGADFMLQHLMREHDIGKQRARFLTHKLVEWRLNGPDLFPALKSLIKQKSVRYC